MSDELRGQIMYEKEARNWPTPLEWDKLPKGTQYLWIQRAKGKSEQNILHK